jgi:hypothetical protein
VLDKLGLVELLVLLVPQVPLEPLGMLEQPEMSALLERLALRGLVQLPELQGGQTLVMQERLETLVE